jgi:hypothetical protein
MGLLLAAATGSAQIGFAYLCPSRPLDDAPFLYTIPAKTRPSEGFSMCLRSERCFQAIPNPSSTLLVFLDGNNIRLPVLLDVLLDASLANCPPLYAYARFNIPPLPAGRYEIRYEQRYVLLDVPPRVWINTLSFDLLEPVSVPTLSKWGNVALVGLVFGLGTLTVWRRHGAR